MNWLRSKTTRSEGCYPITVFHDNGRVITESHPLVRYGLVFMKSHGWAIPESYAPVVSIYRHVINGQPLRFIEYRRIVHQEPPSPDKVTEVDLQQQAFQDAQLGVSFDELTCDCPALVRPRKIKRLLKNPWTPRMLLAIWLAWFLASLFDRGNLINYWTISVTAVDFWDGVAKGIIKVVWNVILAHPVISGLVTCTIWTSGVWLWRKVRGCQDPENRTPEL